MRRSLSLAENCVYLRIYAPKVFQTKIIEDLYDVYLADLSIKWFFIRYWLPKPHIRLRILCDSNTECLHILKLLVDHLGSNVESGIVIDFSIHTYERELERYGNQNITTFEELFQKDSINVVVLNRYFSSATHNLSAIIGFESLLIGLGIDVNERLRIYRMMLNTYSHELGTSKHSVNKKLNQKYEVMRKSILQLVREMREDSSSETQILVSECIHRVKSIDAEKLFRRSLIADDKHVVYSLIHIHAVRHGLVRIEEYGAIFLVYRALNALLNTTKE